MEDQTIETIMAPRIILKKGLTIGGLFGWEIASSSSDDKKELKKIVEMLGEINQDMIKKYQDPIDELEEDDEATIRKEPEREKSTDDQ